MGNIQRNLLSMLRPTTMTSAGLIAIMALTFYLRLLYFGQIIDGDVGRAGLSGLANGRGRDSDRSRRSREAPALFHALCGFHLAFWSLCPGTQDVWDGFCPHGGPCNLLVGEASLRETDRIISGIAVRSLFIRTDDRRWDGEPGDGVALSLYPSYRSFP